MKYVLTGEDVQVVFEMINLKIPDTTNLPIDAEDIVRAIRRGWISGESECWVRGYLITPVR